jgi:hypothetical protein
MKTFIRGGRRGDSITQAIQTTVTGLVLSLQIPECEEKPKVALSTLINHFILIDCSIYASPIGQQLSTDGATEQNVHLVRIVDSIIAVFSLQECDIEKVSNGVFDLVCIAFETAKTLLDDPAKTAKLPFFVIFAKKICESCFQRAWYAKSCARHVINMLIDYMPNVWLCEHGFNIFGALGKILK